MDIALLIGGLLAGAYLMQFLFADPTEQRVGSFRLVIWRWVFLCGTTVLTTLLFLDMRLSRGRGSFGSVDYPYQIGLLRGLDAAATIFFLFTSPFFFRSVRPWAVLSWVVAVLSAFLDALPRY